MNTKLTCVDTTEAATIVKISIFLEYLEWILDDMAALVQSILEQWSVNVNG